MTSIEESILEARNGSFEAFKFEYEFRVALRTLWGAEPDEPTSQVPDALSYSLDISDVHFSLADPEPLPWSIAFTPTFRKAIATADRKLQGRVLSALTELSETPTTVHGDTRKPLSGELKGLWRYRFGDYRLVYEPREANRIVVLVDFGSRGTVYES